MLTAILFILGLGLLTFGADFLVKGAAKLAATVGVSSLVIGLTVVSMGTSAPELAVSISAGLAGQGEIAVGNVVGSNIFNVLFILGISAAIVPLAVEKQMVSIEAPIMIAASVLMLVMCLDGSINRLEGLILVTGLIIYIWTTVARGRRQTAESIELKKELKQEFGPTEPATLRTITRDLVFITIGLVMLVLGARWLVAGAVECARWLGVSEAVIGLTIIAIGTSLPEVATSIAAAVRGERDLAVGNVVGSNIFNILGVLGVAAVVSPNGVAVAAPFIQFDIPLMVVVALMCLPIFYVGRAVSRFEGVFLLGCFVAYTVYLLLDQTHSPAFEMYRRIVIWVVGPLVAVILAGASVVQWLRPRSASRAR